MSINQIAAAVSSVASIAGVASPTDARLVIKESVSLEKVHQADAGHKTGDVVSDAELKKSVDAINRFF